MKPLILLALVLAAPVPVTGWATYYDAPSGAFAAGPALREALGSDWRGTRVTVCAGRCVTGTLSDWCACGQRHGTDTVIDLPRVDFARLAPLSQGVVRVTVTLAGAVLSPPPTDLKTAPAPRPREAMRPV